MKSIYSFTVELTKEVEEKTKEKRKNKETGKEEEVEVSKKVKKKTPHKIVIKEPSRRQLEEADMEYSIEISRCIKKGILTKAMLAKKYSDTGGILTEKTLCVWSTFIRIFLNWNLKCPKEELPPTPNKKIQKKKSWEVKLRWRVERS